MFVQYHLGTLLIGIVLMKVRKGAASCALGLKMALFIAQGLWTQDKTAVIEESNE